MRLVFRRDSHREVADRPHFTTILLIDVAQASGWRASWLPQRNNPEA